MKNLCTRRSTIVFLNSVPIIQLFAYRAGADEAIAKGRLVRTIFLVFTLDEMDYSVNTVLNAAKIVSVAV